MGIFISLSQHSESRLMQQRRTDKTGGRKSLTLAASNTDLFSKQVWVHWGLGLLFLYWPFYSLASLTCLSDVHYRLLMLENWVSLVLSPCHHNYSRLFVWLTCSLVEPLMRHQHSKASWFPLYNTCSILAVCLQRTSGLLIFFFFYCCQSIRCSPEKLWVM